MQLADDAPRLAASGRGVPEYFRKLQKRRVWQELNNTLRGKVRLAVNREEQPLTLVADSQSVKTTEKGGFVASMVVKGAGS